MDAVAPGGAAVNAFTLRRSMASDARLVGRTFEGMSFRYLGGLAGYRSGFDVDLRCESDSLVLTEKNSGESVVRISPWSVLCMSSFPDEVPALNTTVGFVFGPLVTFPSATVKGGGLLIVYSTHGSHSQVVVGNRSGLFATTLTFESYRLIPGVIGFWLDSAAELHEAEIGTTAYAADLGLDSQTKHSDEGESVPRSVRDALAELEELKRDGLVTADEYASARARILHRLS